MGASGSRDLPADQSHISLGKDSIMVKVEDIQQYGKEHFETVVASATTLQNGFQAIASAYGDYTKKSFEDTKSFVEKLSGVKSLDKAIEVQTEYAKSAYETFVAESQKIAGTLYRSRQGRPSSRWKAWSRSSPRPPRRHNNDIVFAIRFRKSKARPSRPGFSCRGICRDYRATRSLRQRGSDRIEGGDDLACRGQHEEFTGVGWRSFAARSRSDRRACWYSTWIV